MWADPAGGDRGRPEPDATSDGPGRPRHSWLTQHFQDLLAAAGLPKMRLHDLRHGAATLLLGAGVHPRVAQQLLRHASSKTTTEIYSHVTAAQERQAAEVQAAALVG